MSRVHPGTGRHLFLHGAASVAFQPIVAVDTKAIAGYEALVRYGNADHAGAFLRQAIALGLTNAVDRIVRVECVRQRHVWADAMLFLNVDPVPDVDCETVAGGYRRWVLGRGIDPGTIVFEISERAPIVGGPGAQYARAFRAAGFRIAVDDVGVGASGLGALIAVKPDYLKVDGSITRALPQDPWARAFLTGLLSAASAVGARVVAEGVETEEQFRVLRGLGVTYAQGYYLGRPVVHGRSPTLAGSGDGGTARHTAHGS